MATDRASAGLRLAVSFAGLGFADQGGLAHIPELARVAEEVGVDQLAIPDHVMLGPVTEGYPFGNFPEKPDSPYPEPLTVLAAVASVTSRLELSPSALIVPLRPAALLAKTCATLDVLSRGRLVLGVGTGWHRDEFGAVGVPFAGRGQRLDDTIRACRALWSQTPASFSSATVSFENAWCEPRPLRPDSIQIWPSGSATESTIARIVEYGSGWIAPPSFDARELAEGVALLRQALAEAGRDPRSINVKITVPIRDRDLAGSLNAAVPAFVAAGATMIQVPVRGGARSTEAAPAFLDRLATCFAEYRSMKLM